MMSLVESDGPGGAGGSLSPATRTALAVLGAALGLGLLGDQILFSSPGLGLGGLIWVAALSAAVLGVARWSGIPFTGEGRWLLAGASLFAAGMVWRGSPLLQFLDVLAIGICLGLAALTAPEGKRLSRTGVLSYPLGLVLSGLYHVAGPFSLLLHDIRWQEVPRGRWSERLAAVLRGLLIALPLLMLFGLLFIAADAVFEQLVQKTFRFDTGRLFGHLFGTLFFAFLAAGFLRTVLLNRSQELPRVSRPTGFGLGPIETGVVLGLLNLLFLAFVAVQVRYLFGGEAQLAASGLTYAEYARRGFFELSTVTGLVLPVLLALHWLVPADQAGEQRLFRWLGGSLVVMLFVIMGSALQRMFLYQQEYGLTELRLYTTAFMGWMALLFGWFLVTVLRGMRERFAVGALVSGLLVLGLLHMINPEALIIRTNVARYQENGRFDAIYAASLGPDAVPALMEALPKLDPAQQEEVLLYLQPHLDYSGRHDWRAWNWGRSQALQALQPLLPAQPGEK